MEGNDGRKKTKRKRRTRKIGKDEKEQTKRRLERNGTDDEDKQKGMGAYTQGEQRKAGETKINKQEKRQNQDKDNNTNLT